MREKRQYDSAISGVKVVARCLMNAGYVVRSEVLTAARMTMFFL
jgi:hypothetical protein